MQSYKISILLLKLAVGFVVASILMMIALNLLGISLVNWRREIYIVVCLWAIFLGVAAGNRGIFLWRNSQERMIGRFGGVTGPTESKIYKGFYILCGDVLTLVGLVALMLIVWT